MRNLEKELYWQHRLKTFFPNGINEREMVLMSVKNHVYNELARQNIFFVLLIQFRF